MIIYDDVGGCLPLPDDISINGKKLVINCKNKMIIMIDLDTIKQAIKDDNNNDS